MENLRKGQLLLVSISVASIFASFISYSILPSLIAIHFNFYGVPDYFVPKEFGLILFPLFIIALSLILSFSPMLDKKYKNNFKKFVDYYDYFVSIICAFFLIVYVEIIEFNLGKTTDLLFTVAIGLCLISFFAGQVLVKSKRNRFLGIHTKMTLSSEKNWIYSNQLLGKTLQIVGLIGLVISILSSQTIYFIFTSIIFVIPIASLYSQYKLARKIVITR